MKTLYKQFSICFLIISSIFISCEDFAVGDRLLQKPPSGDVTIDTIFSNAEYAKRILWYSYSKLPYHTATGYNNTHSMWVGNLEALTDLNQSYLSWDGPSTLYYSGSYNAGKENGNSNSGNAGTKYRFTGRGSWPGIRHAWLFIENAHRVPDMNADEKKRLTAEAKIIIATQYAEMFRHYGALPIVDRAIKPEEAMPVRATLEETLNFIIKLLDEAIATEELPWALPADEINNWDGRMTKAAAMGLKVRMLLFAASPLFNSDTPYFPGDAADKKMTWFGNYDKQRWVDAEKAAKEFFDAVAVNGHYELVTTGEERMAFRDAYYTRGTTESLISVRYSYQTTNFLMQATRWGASCPTKEYFDMFPMSDGSDFDWNNPEHAKNPFINRDPRLYETILVDGDLFGGVPAEINKAKPDDKVNYPQGKHWAFKNILDNPSLSSGLPLRKFVLDRQGEYRNRVTHWPYLRMAEIYLSYAEILNELDKKTEALNYINAVRNRVGLSGLKNSLSKEQLRERILRERACEFGWEHVRFFDLIRWKRDADFTKRLHGIDLFKNKNTGEYLINVKKLKERAWQKESGFSPKWYLSAFPTSEIDKGYGLIQNPGWD